MTIREKSNAKKLYDICTKTKVNVDIDKVLGLKEKNDIREILKELCGYPKCPTPLDNKIDQALTQIIDTIIEELPKDIIYAFEGSEAAYQQGYNQALSDLKTKLDKMKPNQ